MVMVSESRVIRRSMPFPAIASFLAMEHIEALEESLFRVLG